MTNKVKRALMKLLGISNVLNAHARLENKVKEMLPLLREIHNAELFHDLIVDSSWLKYKNFKPGGWAVDYGLLCTLYQVLNKMKPKNILEFGLGESSKMIHQYAAYHQVNAVTVEHDPEWVKFFNSGRGGDYDVNISLLDVQEVEYKGGKTLSYKGIHNFFGDTKYDLIIVDAPFGSEHFSRSQIIDLTQNNISDSFCIIIDDCNRTGEMETKDEVENILRDREISFASCIYSSSKDHGVICSSNMRFLISL